MNKDFSQESPRSVISDRATETDIYHAYRLFLGREPDRNGFAHYRNRIASGLTIATLVQIFMGSDEYREHKLKGHLEHETAIDIGGYSVVVDRNDPDFGTVITQSHTYEEPIRQVLREGLHPGDICLDVGANVGVVTLLAASLVGHRGHVIAVEPNPSNVQLLYRGILHNRFTNVEVIPLAASDRRAIFGMSGLSNTELVDVNSTIYNGRLAQSVVLDEVLGTLPRLDLVKLDIEGQEPAALRGLQRQISTHQPTLVVEFNPRCLNKQQESESELLSWILDRYTRVRAISHFGDDQRFSDPDELLAFWRKRATEVAASGALPDGMLHFDLVTERG